MSANFSLHTIITLFNFSEESQKSEVKFLVMIVVAARDRKLWYH